MKVSSFLKRSCAVLTVGGFIATGAVVGVSPAQAAVPDFAYMQPSNLAPFAGQTVRDELPETIFRSISAGYDHSLGLDEDGNVYAWGNNASCQLGAEATVQKSQAPIEVHFDLANGVSITEVVAGHDTSFAIDNTHAVWAWGYNYYGGLGIGSSEDACVAIPQQVEITEIVQTIIPGNRFTYALTADDSLWGWGHNLLGEIGDVGNGQRVETPTQMFEEDTFKSVAAGASHGVAIKSDDEVVTWGSDAAGQLIGEKDEDRDFSRDFFFPLENVILEQGDTIVEVAAGTYHSIARSEQGAVYTWGDNGRGQLGRVIDETVTNTAERVGNLGTATSIYAGSTMSGAVVQSSPGVSDLFMWGNNHYGQIGVGSPDEIFTAPQKTDFPQGVDLSSKTISFGGSHVFVNPSEGEDLGASLAWGNEGEGQLASNVDLGNTVRVPERTMKAYVSNVLYFDGLGSRVNISRENIFVEDTKWGVKNLPSEQSIQQHTLYVTFKLHGKELDAVERYLAFVSINNINLTFSSTTGARFADGTNAHELTATFTTQGTSPQPVTLTSEMIKLQLGLKAVPGVSDSEYEMGDFDEQSAGVYVAQVTSESVDTFRFTSEAVYDRFQEIVNEANAAHQFIGMANMTDSSLEIEAGQRFADGKDAYAFTATIFDGDDIPALYPGLSSDNIKYLAGLQIQEIPNDPESVIDFPGLADMTFEEESEGVYTAQYVSSEVVKYDLLSKLDPPANPVSTNRILDFVAAINFETSRVQHTTAGQTPIADGSTEHELLFTLFKAATDPLEQTPYDLSDWDSDQLNERLTHALIGDVTSPDTEGEVRYSFDIENAVNGQYVLRVFLNNSSFDVEDLRVELESNVIDADSDNAERYVLQYGVVTR